MTAFVATRFIGFFESTIQDLVSLATLMPIVASIGGNTGNQTVALVIRGFAFDQLTDDTRRRFGTRYTCKRKSAPALHPREPAC